LRAIDDLIGSDLRSKRVLNFANKTAVTSKYAGGGDPAKKLFERNRFATAETFACKLGVKSVFEVVMRRVASQLADGDQGLPRANHVPRAN
jgi:hypothetical protein